MVAPLHDVTACMRDASCWTNRQQQQQQQDVPVKY